MLSRRPVALGIFALWTLLVWVGRVRNIWADDALEGGEKAAALVPAVVFCLLGVGLAWLAVGHPSETITRRLTAGAAIFTIGYWLIRAVLIALNDHSFGFVAVHTVLALVSAATAAWAWRVVDRGDPCDDVSGPARLDRESVGAVGERGDG